MRRIRTLIVLASLAAGITALLGAASRAQDAAAQAFLQSIYATYQNSDKAVDIGSQQKAARWFIPSVAKLIGRDVAESKKRNEVGRLDFDPFIGGQDWAPTKIDLAVAAGTKPDRATGTARFTPPGEKKERVVTLDLARTQAGWRVADIRWEGEADSLVAILSRKN